jgi:hypothetical protein
MMLPPTQNYTGPFNIANLEYPDAAPADYFNKNGVVVNAKLTQETAPLYMAALKKYLAHTLVPLINKPETWDAQAAGWYDMVWLGAADGGDPTSGREAIMNTYGGQIVPSDSWAPPYTPTTNWMQNYGVIYYDPMAASMLNNVWANLYEPDLSMLHFPDGSIVVKIEAATVQPYEWPRPRHGSVLAGAAEWPCSGPRQKLRRRTRLILRSPLENVVQTIFPFQLAIKVKDSRGGP